MPDAGDNGGSSVSAWEKAIKNAGTVLDHLPELLPEVGDGDTSKFRSIETGWSQAIARAGTVLDHRPELLHEVAADLKLRAERKAGEMLRAMPKHGGGRPSENRLHDVTSSLADVGVTKIQSHRWQQVAAVPEPEFGRHLVEVDGGGGGVGQD